MYNKLTKLRAELKVPKNQYNKFGGYYYRSCEDILEAVKPLLEKNKLTLLVSDEIVSVDGRFYIKATAKLVDNEKPENYIENVAYAREEESKKGMDSSQVTGTASSYARKYALNGLFLIDDTKDADTDEYVKTTTETPKATEKQLELIQELFENDVEELKEILKKINKTKIAELTVKEASDIISAKK